MGKHGMMKRKSCDALDFSVHTQPKKDRAWYDQEHHTDKERSKDKKRLSFIGNIFSKMKSSSKLTSSTSSLHNPGYRTASEENSFRSTSEHSTISVESHKYKKNAHLKTFFNSATNNADFSMGEGSSEADSIGSVGSLNTPVRGDGLNRESENRHSSRSMPAPATPHESTVRRAHSTVTGGVNDSPSVWLRRKSLRLRQKKMEPEMEELKEEEEMDYALDETQASSDPSQSTSFHATNGATPKSIFVSSSKIDRSRSAAAYSTRQKVLQKRSEESPICFSTAGTPDVVGTMGKKLTPSTGSTSALQKFGAALKRGFSSGSRAQRTPRNGSQTTDALVTVMRKPTLDNRRAHDSSRLRGRRMSDVSSYGDLSMHHTPRNMEESLRGAFFDADMTALTGAFSSKVSVPLEVEAVLTDDSFDAVVVDVSHDGTPVSDYSRTLVAQLDMEQALKTERAKAPLKTSGFIKRNGRPPYVIWVLISDTDRGRQLRMGYEAALNTAFSHQEIRRLMLPQLFCTTADLMEERVENLGDSILRSTYMAFVRGDNHTKMDSIVVVGNDVACAAHLNDCLDKLISEKVNGRMHVGLTGSSFRK